VQGGGKGEGSGGGECCNIIIIIIINMLMPVQQNKLHILESYWHSLTKAFCPNVTSVVDGRICPSLGGLYSMAQAIQELFSADSTGKVDRAAGLSAGQDT
jgi:hypothetical protein